MVSVNQAKQIEYSIDNLLDQGEYKINKLLDPLLIKFFFGLGKPQKNNVLFLLVGPLRPPAPPPPPELSSLCGPLTYF